MNARERVQEAGPGENRGEGTAPAPGAAPASPGKRYGVWAGNPKGTPENPAKCCEEVWPTGRSMIPYQCPRPRGHGKDGAYCSQHARDTTAIKPFSMPFKRK